MSGMDTGQSIAVVVDDHLARCAGQTWNARGFIDFVRSIDQLVDEFTARRVVRGRVLLRFPDPDHHRLSQLDTSERPCRHVPNDLITELSGDVGAAGRSSTSRANDDGLVRSVAMTADGVEA